MLKYSFNNIRFTDPDRFRFEVHEGCISQNLILSHHLTRSRFKKDWQIPVTWREKNCSFGPLIGSFSINTLWLICFVRPVQVIKLDQTDSECRIRRFKYFSRRRAFTFQPLSVSVVLSAAEIQLSASRLSSKWTVETKAALYRLGRSGSCVSPQRSAKLPPALQSILKS